MIRLFALSVKARRLEAVNAVRRNRDRLCAGKRKPLQSGRAVKHQDPGGRRWRRRGDFGLYRGRVYPGKL